MRGFFYFSFIALVALTVAPFFADRFWLAELCSHFVAHWALLGLFLAFVFTLWQKKFLAFLALILVAVNGYKPAALFFPNAQEVKGGEEIRLAHLNVYYKNENWDEIGRFVEDSKTVRDVILLQETTPYLISEIEEVVQGYPYKFLRPHPRSGGTVLLSKYPMEVETFKTPDGSNYYVKATLQKGEEKISLYTLHTMPPVSPAYLEIRNKQLDMVAKAIREDKAEYKILVGDFNTSPYSPYFEKLIHQSNLNNSMRGFGVQNSWFPIPEPLRTPLRFLFGVPIDHVLTSENMAVTERRILPNLGSDHFGVEVKVLIPQ